MRFSDANWMLIEKYLTQDDRVVIPLGSTEQHAYLSLSTDSILAERVAVEAAGPLGIPVCPVLPFGITPYFLAYPGSISIREETYCAMLGDMLDSLHGYGFRQFFLVNGHGGNQPAAAFAADWQSQHAGTRVLFHNWWRAERTWQTVQAIDPLASHASWMENFPWTRLPGVTMPEMQKAMVDVDGAKPSGPTAVREVLGDGNYAGLYQRPDSDMTRVWSIAVEETRALMTGAQAFS